MSDNEVSIQAVRMTGSIAANLHEGSRSEYLAKFAASSFGTAVAVPHQNTSAGSIGYAPVLDSAPPASRGVRQHAEHRRHKLLKQSRRKLAPADGQVRTILQRFKSAEHAQRFLVPFRVFSNHFHPRRHRLTASSYRQIRLRPVQIAVKDAHDPAGRSDRTERARSGFLN